MNRLDAMLDRLPPIYGIDEGTLLRQVLGVIAVDLATWDEDLDRVQRSHWVRTAFTRSDLERLAELVDVQAAPWESEDFFRARLVALTKARLDGAVTWAAIEAALLRILDSADKDLGVRWFSLVDDRGRARRFNVDAPPPALIEFPLVLRRSPELVARRGLVRALDRFPMKNEGFRPAWVQGTVRGLAGAVTSVPLLVNLTNGHAVGYAGRLRAGEELVLTAGSDGSLTGRVGDRDVTSRLVTTRGFPLDDPDARAPLGRDANPTAIALEPGPNVLWFAPVGLYDNPSFDHALFAWPSSAMGQGRWADADLQKPGFDDAVFHTPDAASLDLWWLETSPAAFRVDVPVGAVRRTPSRSPDDLTDALLDVLRSTIDQLRAAAVRAEVRGARLESTQTARDACRVASVQLPDEPASAGQSAEIALSALFDATIPRANRFA
ncbi:MAG TPA: hypothetical protein PKA64_19180 [Myxococcota bacterium]|nr:hypothetical protein [Myxococcota bacterium]